MRFIQIQNLLLQFRCLVGSNSEILQKSVIRHGFGIVITHFRLHQIGTQQRMCHKCTGQSLLQNIVTHLKTQVVTGDILLQLRGFRRIEFHRKMQWPQFRREEFGNRLLQIEPNAAIATIVIGETKIVLLDNIQASTDGV